jgi:hypothetical protein
VHFALDGRPLDLPEVTTDHEPRFMLFHGRPCKEPILSPSLSVASLRPRAAAGALVGAVLPLKLLHIANDDGGGFFRDSLTVTDLPPERYFVLVEQPRVSVRVGAAFVEYAFLCFAFLGVYCFIGRMSFRVPYVRGDQEVDIKITRFEPFGKPQGGMRVHGFASSSMR